MYAVAALQLGQREMWIRKIGGNWKFVPSDSAPQPNVFPIPRASTVPHVNEDPGASGWRTKEDDLRDVDRLYAT